MVIIRCIGGLGNQMFQYAFYRALELSGADVRLDISSFSGYNMHNGFELGRIFPINPIYSTVNESEPLLYPNLFFRILRKLRIYNRFIVQKDFQFNKKYLKYHGNCYLDGYWQSEKYFANYKEKIKQEFTFPKIDNENLKYAKLIQDAKESVAVHVRRGDYVNHQLHGDICTLEYYHAAIKLMKQKILNPEFYIFSDDIRWCEEHLNVNNAIYISGNTGYNTYRDMQLMSMCKHNIIANSSFSWWAAWLNNNLTKLTIAPKKWFNHPALKTYDICPKQWVMI